MNGRARVEWLDAAKGVGIILVVLGHAFRDEMREVSALCDFIYSVVYSIHMPLFFIISGYIYAMGKRKRQISEKECFIKKKTSSLLVPMVSYAVLMYIFFFAAWSIPLVRGMLESSSYQYMGAVEYAARTLIAENPYAIHLWYLWILYLILLTAYMIDLAAARLGDRAEKLILSIALIFYLIRMTAPMPNNLVRYYCNFFIYFASGMIFASDPQVIQYKNSGCRNLLAAVAWILLILRAGFRIEPDVWYLKYAWKFYSQTGAALSILNICWRMGEGRLLPRLGRNSFTIYLLHQPFCCGFMGLLLYGKLGLPILPAYAACVLLSFLLPYWAVKVGRKFRWTRVGMGKFLHIY